MTGDNLSTVGNTISSSPIGASPYGAIIGAGLSVAGSLMSKAEEKRRREKEVQEALARNNIENGILNAQRSEAEGTRRIKAMLTRRGQVDAVQQALRAGGSHIPGGEGDVGSSTLSAIQNAPGVMAAQGQGDAQIAQGYNERDSLVNDLNKQLHANNQQRGQMAYDYTDYIQDNTSNDLFQKAVAGATTMAQFEKLYQKDGTKETINQNDPNANMTTGQKFQKVYGGQANNNNFVQPDIQTAAQKWAQVRKTRGY